MHVREREVARGGVSFRQARSSGPGMGKQACVCVCVCVRGKVDPVV